MESAGNEATSSNKSTNWQGKAIRWLDNQEKYIEFYFGDDPDWEKYAPESDYDDPVSVSDINDIATSTIESSNTESESNGSNGEIHKISSPSDNSSVTTADAVNYVGLGQMGSSKVKYTQSSLERINNFLDANEFAKNDTVFTHSKDNTYKKIDIAFTRLGMFLIKLPFRAIRNVINLIFSIVKTAVNFVFHPVKTFIKLLKLIISLLNAVTLTQIGAGMIGASLGQSLLGNPLSLIGIIVGAALIVGGISIGAMVTAIKNKHNKSTHVKNEIIEHFKAIPEAALTGFLLGLMVGAIQQAQTHQNHHSHKSTASNAADATPEIPRRSHGHHAPYDTLEINRYLGRDTTGYNPDGQYYGRAY